jgi:2-iminobutanoate/2-iminopropanoate deaminase
MKKVIATSEAPSAIGPYSQAMEVNGTLYISGQIPLMPGTGKLIEGDISVQTEQVMKNIGAILKEAGYDYNDVIKTTCLLSDINDFKAMNEVYGRYFTGNKPVRAAFSVKGIPMGSLIEIETIAVKG